MVSIVTVNVSLTQAPSPSTLQRTGAIVSHGGTNTSPGTYTLLTQLSSLTPILNTAKALSGLSWSGGTVTATTASAHGLTIGDTITLTLAGNAPSAYNGTYACTVTTSTAFTYALASNPGSETTAGTWIPGNVATLTQQATTFFAQGSSASVYVLETGPVGDTLSVNFLSAWITANPGVFYSYLVPRSFDGNSGYLSLVQTFESPTSKTYFFTTTTLSTYTAYTALEKSVLTMIEAPAYGVWPANALTAITWTGGQATATTTTAHGVSVGQWFQIAGVSPSGYNGWWQAQTGTTGSTLVYNLPNSPGGETVLGTLVASYYSSSGIGATEFSFASTFYDTLNYNPSPTNQVTPLNYTFEYGVTPFPLPQNAALLTTLYNAAVNTISTGAQGGISDALVTPGQTMDGNDFTYWYSVDYAQINLNRNLANAVINGSNNPVNPLYYNQAGINSLQAVAASTMNTMVSNGLALGTVIQTELDAATFQQNLDAGLYAGNIVVNAIPFGAYAIANPNDYGIGKYAGLAVVYTPSRGFEQIIVNLNVTEFVAA